LSSKAHFGYTINRVFTKEVNEMNMGSMIPMYAAIGAFLGYAVGSNSSLGHPFWGILTGFIVGGIFGILRLYFMGKNQ